MRIFCIGRNYIDHAKELNNKVPKQPLIFMKPESALNQSGKIPYPAFSENFQYELEIILFISKDGKNITIESAAQYYDGIGLGIDYTARDVQSKCKEKGHSWEIAKAFDDSAYISKKYPVHNFDLEAIKFELRLNDTIVQKGDSRDMIFNFNYLLTHVSKYFELKAGDILMTGTPAGVGPLETSDTIKGYLNGELVLENLIMS